MRTAALVARFLFLGGLASVALMLAGLIALEGQALAGGHSIDTARIVEDRQAGRSVDVVVSLPQLGRSLRRWPPFPVAIMTSGIVMLLLTPVLTAAAALAGFVHERDSTYAVIAALLIFALLFGFALGLVG